MAKIFEVEDPLRSHDFGQGLVEKGVQRHFWWEIVCK